MSEKSAMMVLHEALEQARREERIEALKYAAAYFHDGPWRCSRASRILEGLARGESRPDGIEKEGARDE